MANTQQFEQELNNPGTRFFILDSHANDESGKGDVDFEVYGYDTSINKQLSEGDLIIYRRPGKNGKKFHFFGAAKIKKIQQPDPNKTEVIAYLDKPFKPEKFVYQGDSDLENIVFLYRNRKLKQDGTPSWTSMFNQYGITEIRREDFESLIDLF